MSSKNTNEINEQIKTELLKCFRLFSDIEYTGYDPLRPVAKIIFAGQGEITTPPDLDFMGYGGGSEGESFSDCGILSLESFFPLNEEGDYYASEDEEFIEECFQNACSAVLKGLQVVAPSKEFQKIPKEGPVVFGLKLIDQCSKIICRIHPDGELELPPR